MNRLLGKVLCNFQQPRGYMSSWSRLANVFNTRPTPIVRTLLQKDKGLFLVPELISYMGFEVLKERCEIDTTELINEAISPDRTRKMVEIFDELSDNLCKVADLAEFIRLAHPNHYYTHAAESACASVSGIVEKLNTHRKLYEALRRVVEHGDITHTDEVDDLVAKLFLFDFEQSGIHLSESDRQKVVTLNDKILILGQAFVASSSDPRVINKSRLPKGVLSLFPSSDEYISVHGLNAESASATAREVSYRTYLHPDGEQDSRLTRLLQCRYELAVTCGFNTYAERALNGSMLQTPGNAKEFLDRLSEHLKFRADHDFLVMEQMKKSEAPNAGRLAAWDVPYYTQKFKREMFQIGTSDYSPYFSLGACMEGLNLLLESLYGISFKVETLEVGEAWVDDIYKLGVYHEDEGLLGYVYCDFYERAGKPNQDCHFTIRGGKYLGSSKYQLPVVVLMLNLPLPHWSCPTLLTPGMVDNLFHEMGHAMHSMLGRTCYQHVTGTRCSTDFAEVPSVLMEYFARDPRVIKTFARHYQTKEAMPDDMLRKLCASKDIFTASEMQMQLFYSALDQSYHDKYPLNGSTTDLLAEVQGKYYSLPYVQQTAWQLRFSHLVGYGAKYYSYLVSTALASWIWQSYFAEDPLNRSQGERFRRDCLAHGGGKPPWKLVADFLEKEPTPKHLVNSLINEIDNKQEYLQYFIKK